LQQAGRGCERVLKPDRVS